MSRKNSRTVHSVSLFPFLAVLVCAMGALIFLLLVTTRRVRSDAVAAVRAMPEEEPMHAVVGPSSGHPSATSISSPAVWAAPSALDQSAEALAVRADFAPPFDPDRRRKELHDEWAGIVADLSRQNAQRRADHERRMRAFAALRRKHNEAEAELSRHQQRLRELEREQERMAASGDEYDDERIVLVRKIAETRDRLAQVRRANQSQGSRYAFVPFDGQSGTTRRPILIECTAEAIRFLPENIELTKSELNGFTPGFNPVLAGSEALIDYWDAVDRRRALAGDDASTSSRKDTRSSAAHTPHGAHSTSHDRESSGESESRAAHKPYVLLIVRPGGGLAFHIARKFLSRCSQPFGYELIEADWELELPESDPQAADTCQRAIARVLAEREKLIAQLGGRSAFVRGLRLDRDAQGLAFDDQDEDPFTPGRRQSFSDRTIERGRGGLSERPEEHGFAADNGLSLQPTERRLPSGLGRGAAGDRGSQTGERRTADRWNSSFEEGQQEIGERRGTIDGFADASNRSESSSPSGNALSDRNRVRTSLAGPRSFGSNPFRSATDASSQRATPGQRATGEPSEGARRLRIPKRWGIDNPSGSIGYERQVDLIVHADQVVVGEHVVPAGQGESTVELVDDVLTALDRHARSWGRPPKSFYWVPAVKFVVKPDGNVNYERLYRSLQKAGLDTSVQFMLETSESAGKPESP